MKPARVLLFNTAAKPESAGRVHVATCPMVRTAKKGGPIRRIDEADVDETIVDLVARGYGVRACKCLGKPKKNPCCNPKRASKKNPARMIARPHWEPLTDEHGTPRPEIRNALEGRAGVYLLRKKRNARVSYVGSAVPGEKGGTQTARRLWKTITRHFHACTNKKRRGRGYSFGSDNFCDPNGAREYELAVMLTTPSEARELEERAIERFRPLVQPRNAAPKRELEDAPF